MPKPRAHIYIRVSSESQDLVRQEKLIADAQAKGYELVDIYREKVSGTTENRPELQRMLSKLKAGDTIISEHLDRISRLPLDEAVTLMGKIKAKGAKVSVPGLIDLPDADGIAAIVMDGAQDMLLKIALYQCRQDWEIRRQRQAEGIAVAKAADKLKPVEKRKYRGRKADTVANAKIVELRQLGYTIAKVASTLNVSESQVKLICKKAKQAA